MLRYEFVRCMELRSRLAERIKGKIFVGKNGDDVTISIFGCPTCRYQVNLDVVRNNSSIFVSPDNINGLADAIYEDYKQFIQKRFFI